MRLTVGVLKKWNYNIIFIYFYAKKAAALYFSLTLGNSNCNSNCNCNCTPTKLQLRKPAVGATFPQNMHRHRYRNAISPESVPVLGRGS